MGLLHDSCSCITNYWRLMALFQPSRDPHSRDMVQRKGSSQESQGRGVEKPGVWLADSNGNAGMARAQRPRVLDVEVGSLGSYSD